MYDLSRRPPTYYQPCRPPSQHRRNRSNFSSHTGVSCSGLAHPLIASSPLRPARPTPTPTPTPTPAMNPSMPPSPARQAPVRLVLCGAIRLLNAMPQLRGTASRPHATSPLPPHTAGMGAAHIGCHTAERPTPLSLHPPMHPHSLATERGGAGGGNWRGGDTALPGGESAGRTAHSDPSGVRKGCATVIAHGLESRTRGPNLALEHTVWRRSHTGVEHNAGERQSSTPPVHPHIGRR
jgi:hypothetical protein